MNEDMTVHKLGQEIHKIHEIMDSHNKEEFLYRQKIDAQLKEQHMKTDEQHEEVMKILTPMAEIFTSVTLSRKVAAAILKGIILVGAGLAVILSVIKWLRN